MARKYRFDASSCATAAAACLVVLSWPLACKSDAEDDADDSASESADSPSEVTPRDDVPEPSAPEPSAPEPSASVEDDGEPDGPDPDSAAPAAAPDEAPAAPGAAAGNSGSVAPAAAAFASCTRSEGVYGTNCDYVYVTMTQSSPPRCVQLTIDNCEGSYGSRAFSVDAPFAWQLSSASIGSSPDDCELGVFYPDSDIVVAATGSIDWGAVVGRALPTGIVLDVTLQASGSAADAPSVEVVTAEPLDTTGCAD